MIPALTRLTSRVCKTERQPGRGRARKGEREGEGGREGEIEQQCETKRCGQRARRQQAPSALSPSLLWPEVVVHLPQGVVHFVIVSSAAAMTFLH